MSQENQKDMEQYFFRASAADFKKIPGSPIAYWLSESALAALDHTTPLGLLSDPRKGMCTRDNDYFVRMWSEVSFSRIGLGYESREDARESKCRWFPYQKGGEFRQWYGNHINVVDWEDDGYRLLNMEKLGWKGNSTNHNLDYIFKPALIWSKITSGIPNFRYSPPNFLYDDASGICAVHEPALVRDVLGFLCSKVGQFYMGVINPTLNIQPGNMVSMPFMQSAVAGDVDRMIDISQSDWISYEISWDFTCQPLLNSHLRKVTLFATYQQLRAHWRAITLELQSLEEENNRIYIDAYCLQDELTPKLPLKEITLTCNPHYRYGGVKTEAELEAQLQADTMAEFLSYAVGCMFGRYSLDKPGLVLANQGDTLAEYLRQIPEPSFMPDEDNVIPLLDGEWFADDVTERFRTFLRVTFGDEHYEANLAFIEQSLGKDVRKYFIKDFYADHVKRYKKRPIYWLFASPKGTFSALIYLHRYRPDTVSVVLRYLRDFRKKLAARLDYLQQVGISASASQGEKTKANKEVETIKKQLLELDDYERETLYPLATEQVALDLDDGVKVNYLKLGPALKKIVGLDAKGED